MPDPTPTPPTPPPPTKAKRNRAPINQDWVNELTLASEMHAAATKPAYADLMADEEIDAPWLLVLAKKIQDANDLITLATGGTADKETATKEEEKRKGILVAALAQIQKRAKRKYKVGNPQRQKYFINTKIENKRGTLIESVESVQATLATDSIPGVKPAHLTALATALDNYKGIQATQSGAQGDATTARKQLEAAIAATSNTPPTPSGRRPTPPTPASAANSKSPPTRRWRDLNESGTQENRNWQGASLRARRARGRDTPVPEELADRSVRPTAAGSRLPALQVVELHPASTRPAW